MRTWILGVVGLVVATSPPALAQEMTNPADHSRSAASDSAADHGEKHRIVWEMPTQEVRGRRLSPLREEQPVGSYGQPRWTAHRRFGTTRVYVVPAGYFEFEHWVTVGVDDGSAQVALQDEFSLGLPGRVQLDLYSVSEKSGAEGRLALAERKVELRWALARWGALPLNPTLYLEWIGLSEAPDHVEAKLLLGGEAAVGWHWGVNFVFEHETGGPQENSNEITAGLSRTIKDGVFSLGAEAKLAFLDVRGRRGDFVHEHTLGPSFQWMPLHRVHFDVLPLFGVTEAAPKAVVTGVVGYEF